MEDSVQPVAMYPMGEGMFRNALTSKIPLPARWMFERFLCLGQLERIYRDILTTQGEGHFLDKVLQVLKISYTVSAEEMASISKEGPVAVVANHPYGGIDGIILGSILVSVRSDVKVMANYLLRNIPQIASLFIGVDPFGGKTSVRVNARPLRETVTWLKKGGMVCVFPAGEVSHLYVRQRMVTDPPWNPMVSRLIRRTEATVVPVFFSGRNSPAFQLAGLLHPKLRTAMLPREILKRSKERVEVCIGKPIPFRRLRRLSSDQDMIQYLRARTYMLAHRNRGKEGAFISETVRHAKAEASGAQAVTPPQCRDVLKREVSALAPEQQLCVGGRFRTYMAQAHQIPNLMKEIGRLREITFRMAGEGTGKACDNDRFDSHYVHLFLWDGDRHEVAGGYRLGLTDEILMRHGKRGLYSRTLFQYGCRFLDRINPAIELGRSFVSPKYQRSYQPLMLLWKGIGVFVSRNPHYRMLFGPVSITSDYHAISRDLIVAYLKRYKKRTDLARFVKARNPLREDSLGARELKLALQHLDQGTGDMKDLSEMVSEMEAGQKGIPILLKHYVNLGGEFLGFSIDPDFRNAIDALILVDLCRTDPRLLERYMGSGPATRFLRYHYDKCLAQCA